MQTIDPCSNPAAACTAFDHERRLTSGSYADVAIVLKEHLRTTPGASVLIFDDGTGKQIDFDLRGTDKEIAARITKQFPESASAAPRAVGRPKLGVVSREVTLLPQHWEWLAQQPGGASVTLRRLVDNARRAPPTEQALRRKMQERTYNFMAAMAGNRPNFEEASRALFANDMPAFQKLMADWPADIVAHIGRLRADPLLPAEAK